MARALFQSRLLRRLRVFCPRLDRGSARMGPVGTLHHLWAEAVEARPRSEGCAPGQPGEDFTPQIEEWVGAASLPPRALTAT